MPGELNTYKNKQHKQSMEADINIDKIREGL